MTLRFPLISGIVNFQHHLRPRLCSNSDDVLGVEDSLGLATH